MNNIPHLIKDIAKEIKDAGGNAYLVGGYVRDSFRGKESKDFDIEVYKLHPDKLHNILDNHGKVDLVGRSFGIFKFYRTVCGEVDFSVPRKERKSGEGHKGFIINADPDLSIAEATIRRDLTINGLLYDILKKELIDVVGGISDLRKKLIRHINDETFADDPLRVMRVAQLSARLEFMVAKETKALCTKLVSELHTLPRERILMEIEKMLLKAKKPSIGFRFLLEIGALEVLFPELYALVDIEEGLRYHPEGNTFEHIMLALDSVPIKDRSLTLMLAILCHDLGKAVVKSEKDRGAIHFYGHAEASVGLAKTMLNRIIKAKIVHNKVLPLIANHMVIYDLKKHIRKKIIRRLTLKVDVPMLMALHKADKLGRDIKEAPDLGYVDNILKVYEAIKSEVKPIVLGRHLIELGMKPSPLFNGILKGLYEVQLDGGFSTLEAGLVLARGKITQ